MSEAGAARWADAALAAALFAVDPAGTGGVALRALAGPARERWLALLAGLLPPGTPQRRLPLHATDGRLLGGLDLAATLRAGRPVAERGLLAEADGGIVLAAMAERLPPGTTARLGAALDTGAVLLERDGLSGRHPTRFGLVLLDEGMAEDERAPAALLDRLAFQLDLAGLATADLTGPVPTATEVAAARARLARVAVEPGAVEALCTGAAALGIASLRAPWLALRVACAAAALAGRAAVDQADLATAGRLVLAPRATTLPATGGEPEAPPPPDPGPEDESRTPPTETELPLADLVLTAAAAAIPPDLLAQLRLGTLRRVRQTQGGRAGAARASGARGRPTGVRRGDPKGGARLNVVETLRAAAPWQPLRRRERGAAAARVEVRPDDFRITRFKQRTRTTTIFVVDASGSAALNRLAEAKGAVELVLADCYVRRDQVAMVAFRGRAAELLLPPTRSLVRAKRSLAALPGGGGTPLASGIDAAVALAEPIRRKGETPILVLLTDGRANVARDGSGGRPQAEEDALQAARAVCAEGLAALVLDISPKPQPLARRVADAMGARYLPLPHASATTLSAAVRAAAPA